MRTAAIGWDEDDGSRLLENRQSRFYVIGGIILIIILGLTLFLGLLFSAGSNGLPELQGTLRIHLPNTPPYSEKPRFTLFDTSITQESKEKWEASPGVAPPRARIAIIIDDMGYGGEATGAIFSLGIPMTVAVLPGLKASIETAQQAHRRGYEVILHLPMEAERTFLPLGPYGITVSMNTTDIDQKITEALAWVPYARGINNHMGSKATKDEFVLDAVMSTLKKRGLFFVDSRTALHSLAFNAALINGVPTGRRNVFLDNVNKVDYIKGQLEQLIEIGLKHGTAIGIGHTRLSTARAIMEMIPVFRRERIAFVPVSEILIHPDMVTSSPGDAEDTSFSAQDHIFLQHYEPLSEDPLEYH